MQYEEQIAKYLQKEDYIKLAVTKEELEQDKTKRYFELFQYLIAHKELIGKFSGKMALFFPDYKEEEIWHNKKIKDFIAKLNEKCPYLFFFAEKEAGTLKLLTILECATDVKEGDNFALDKEKFGAYLQSQLKGIVLMSEAAGFTPEKAQALVQDVYNYFGI